MASEKRQRGLSRQQLGTNLTGEAAPFSFPSKQGGEDLRPAPLVYVPDLVAKVLQVLEQNERYTFNTKCDRLWTNHPCYIVKIRV